ncbi:MAG: TM1812 family CRISPR-associated protein [Thermofilaceae archaeon]
MSGVSPPAKLVFAALGDVSDLVKCEYYLDASSCQGTGRYETFFSIEALARCHSAKLVKIFIQDSLLLNRLLQDDQDLKDELFSKKALSRADLASCLVRGSWIYSYCEKVLLKEDWDRVDEARRSFESFCRQIKCEITTLPGIASGRRDSYVYTWRGGRENFYRALLAGVVGYALKALCEHAKEDSIDVIVDTTHGINYFAHALVEGVSLACSLYLLRRALQPATITLSHYNSDPLLIRGFEREGVSVRVNRIAEEKIRALVVPRLKEFLENYVAGFSSLEKAAESLAGHWSRGGCTADEWLRALTSCLLLVRGALFWALALALQCRVPTLDEILGRLEEVKVEAKDKDEDEERRVGGDRAGVEPIVRSLTYRWSDGEGASPFVEVLLVSQIVRALSEVAEQLEAGPEPHSILAKCLREYSGEEEGKVREIAARLEQGEGRAPVLDLDRMRTVANHIYPLDTASLIDYEIRKVRALLRRIRGSRPETSSGARKSGRKYLVHQGEGVKLIISLPEAGLDERNFYAHAGLASGTAFIAALIEGKRLVACPYDYEPVMRLTKSTPATVK